jgi:hypothetical protein
LCGFGKPSPRGEYRHHSITSSARASGDTAGRTAGYLGKRPIQQNGPCSASPSDA